MAFSKSVIAVVLMALLACAAAQGPETTGEAGQAGRALSKCRESSRSIVPPHCISRVAARPNKPLGGLHCRNVQQLGLCLAHVHACACGYAYQQQQQQQQHAASSCSTLCIVHTTQQQPVMISQQ
jgi:hypothetical protein